MASRFSRGDESLAQCSRAHDPVALGLLALNLKTVWSAPTTDARLKTRIVAGGLREGR